MEEFEDQARPILIVMVLFFRIMILDNRTNYQYLIPINPEIRREIASEFNKPSNSSVSELYLAANIPIVHTSAEFCNTSLITICTSSTISISPAASVQNPYPVSQTPQVQNFQHHFPSKPYFSYANSRKNSSQAGIYKYHQFFFL